MIAFVVGLVAGSCIAAVVLGLFGDACDECRRRTERRRQVKEYMTREAMMGRKDK